MKSIDELKEVIDNSQNIVVFTGAGISCPPPSNIPDFRSANGLYSEKYGRLSPETIISHSFFMSNTKMFYDFYGSKMVYLSAMPNDAHKYFANLPNVSAVVTQNIDGLHQLAGSKNVYELHGSIHRNYCMKCHKFFSITDISFNDIPHCECGGVIKPDVVLYEEGLNEEVIGKAVSAISSCDTMIVVGTSLTVYPAAGMLRYFRGKNLVLINKQTTSYDNEANLIYNEDIVEVVKALQQK